VESSERTTNAPTGFRWARPGQPDGNLRPLTASLTDDKSEKVQHHFAAFVYSTTTFVRIPPRGVNAPMIFIDRG
jgi:hypothetical protein